MALGLGLLAAALPLPPPLAHAAPVAESRVGGLALVGPSSAHPASVFYSPAALDLWRGHHVFVDSTTKLGLGSYRRQTIDSLTGEPSASGLGEPQDLFDFFPQLFVGLSSSLGSDSVMISLFACTPYAQRLSPLHRGGFPPDYAANMRPRDEDGRQEILDELYSPALQGSARYQVVDLTLYHMFLTLAASYRLWERITVGAGISYVYSFLDLAFVRDAALEGGTRRDSEEYVALDDCGQARPCNYESAAAAEAVRTSGESHGLAFAAGILVRLHERVRAGLGYVSQVVGVGGEDIPFKGDAWVLRSAAVLDNWQARSGSTLYADRLGRSTVTYALPDRLHFGLSWDVTDRWLLDLQFRWLNLSTHEEMVIRLTGTEFRERPRMVDRIVYYRGFQDIFAVQLGAALQVTRAVALQGAVMLETPGVEKEAVTLATVDNYKVDMLLGLAWYAGHRFTLRLGYGLVVMPAVQVDSSALSPGLTVRCVDQHYNVDLQDCKDVDMGRGLPSAAGEYSLMTHRISLSISYDVW